MAVILTKALIIVISFTVISHFTVHLPCSFRLLYVSFFQLLQTEIFMYVYERVKTVIFMPSHLPQAA